MKHSSLLTPLLGLVLPMLAATACGSEGETNTEPGAGSPPAAPAAGGAPGTPAEPAEPAVPPTAVESSVCVPKERVGSFLIYLSGDRTIFSGAVSNGVIPATVPEIVAEEGPCQLLGPRDLFCDPGCATGESCEESNQCIPAPENISVGPVTITGLSEAVEANPNGFTSGYSKTIFEPFPGFEAGQPIALSAAGGDAEPFTLEVTGVTPVATQQISVPVASGSPIAFSWDPAPEGEVSEVLLAVTVNAHGAVKSRVECVVPDSGAFEVPTGITTQLINLGLSGFPRAKLVRRSTAKQSLAAGCVDLTVSSELTLDLAVDGLISCNDHGDCPEGQMCSEGLACE